MSQFSNDNTDFLFVVKVVFQWMRDILRPIYHAHPVRQHTGSGTMLLWTDAGLHYFLILHTCIQVFIHISFSYSSTFSFGMFVVSNPPQTHTVP